MSEILYIKIDQNTEVDHIDVRLGDVAKLECTNASVKPAEDAEASEDPGG